MDDEAAIRTLIATWHQATAAGDLATILSLMDEDVVFMTAGRPPMRGKDAFAAATRRALEGKNRIDGKADTQEVRVFGDWAYCWNQLTVTMHPAGGAAPSRLTGPALSVFRKMPDGRWVIFRDANMIAPDRSPE